MDSELKNNIRRDLKKIAMMTADDNGIVTGIDQYDCLINIEALVQKIISYKDVNFYINKQPFGRNKIDCKHRGILSGINLYLKNDFALDIVKEFPIHCFNPYVELFVRNMRCRLAGEIGLYPHYIEDNDELEKVVNALNGFIGGIRAEAESPEFKKTIRDYERVLNKNNRGLAAYIDHLFSQHARMLVLRVDFGYKKQDRPFMSEDEVNAGYRQAKEDREHLFRNMRSNTLFRHLLGYVWKLEYGLRKGFHYHMLLFFDGAKVREDVSIAKMIGEYWQTTVTQGRGGYYNCNAKKSLYQDCGIGMINHYDTVLRDNLKKAAEYLTKADYYAKIIAQDKGRTFGKGEMTTKTDGRGRPRKYSAHTLSQKSKTA
jgi:hypothetical protein